MNLHPNGTEDGWGYISHLQLQRSSHMDWGNYYYPTGGFVEEEKLESTGLNKTRLYQNILDYNQRGEKLGGNKQVCLTIICHG